MDKKYIYVLPLGKIDLSFFEKLKKDLQKIFNFEIELGDRAQIPDYAYNKGNGKYNGRIILNELAKLNFTNSEKILAITGQDLFTEDLNYIFGQAESGGKICLISTYRLNPEFYLEKTNDELFYNRILKEAVHELGHTFGLKHCDNKKCVMCFSDGIEATDDKESVFCEKCEKVYKYMNF